MCILRCETTHRHVKPLYLRMTSYVSENRTFELHSPDGVHSCVLRGADANETASWFNSLHSALHVLTVKALQEANKVLSPTLIGGELHHIGWLSTRKQRLNYCIEVEYKTRSDLLSNLLPSFLDD